MRKYPEFLNILEDEWRDVDITTRTKITSATAAAAAGKQVGHVPHQTFSIWNKYQFVSKLGAGIGLINRTDMFVGVDNTVVLPRYARVDGALFYTFNEKWRLQANVENLLNRKYILNAVSNTNIKPGPPIALRIGLIARFYKSFY